jgi:hypothetical protein
VTPTRSATRAIPCTGGANAFKHKITITKLLTPVGDDKLSFVAQATLTTPFDPPLDPQENGIRLLIVDANGDTMLDATVTGSVYNRSRARAGR